jgi:hypothetical protein
MDPPADFLGKSTKDISANANMAVLSTAPDEIVEAGVEDAAGCGLAMMTLNAGGAR